MLTGVVIAALILIGLLLNNYVTGKIENTLDDALGQAAVYDDLDVNLFSRQVSLSGFRYEKEGDTITIEELEVKGISYYQYIFNGKISVDEIEISGPDILFTPSKKSGEDKDPKMQREIFVSEINASDGLFRIAKKDSAGDQLYARFPEFSLEEVKIDSGTVRNKIPLAFEGYQIKIDTLNLDMNPEHYIAAGDLHIQQDSTRIRDFRIVPKYSREEFNRRVPYEKDHVSLRIEEIGIDSLSFEFINDSLHLESQKVRISGGDLDIYRNKLLADDPRIKPLYSKMLREVPVKLNLPVVRVENSRIEYNEQVQEQRSPATVLFTNVSGTIENVVNQRMGRDDFPRTQIVANALFMEEVPISLEWSFNVTNPNDQFVISGEFGTVPAEAINSFLRPAMDLEAEGSLEAVYFTFSGNDEVAQGETKIEYDRFKINLLKDQGSEEKGFLTALVNLFVDNDGVSGENIQEDLNWSREKNKSFWNYVWTGLQKGLIDAVGQL